MRIDGRGQGQQHIQIPQRGTSHIFPTTDDHVVQLTAHTRERAVTGLVLDSDHGDCRTYGFTSRVGSRLPTKPGSTVSSPVGVRNIRYDSRPMAAAAMHVARVWLDCRPPMVTTQSAPRTFASASRNSSFRILLPVVSIPGDQGGVHTHDCHTQHRTAGTAAQLASAWCVRK